MQENQSMGKIVGKGVATAALIVLFCFVPATLLAGTPALRARSTVRR